MEVTFRTFDDEDDVIRVDNINYSITEEYGFVLESEDFGFYDDEFEDEEDDGFEIDSKIELDEYELVSFLIAYKEINLILVAKVLL